jgi:hypothetical protein
MLEKIWWKRCSIKLKRCSNWAPGAQRCSKVPQKRCPRSILFNLGKLKLKFKSPKIESNKYLTRQISSLVIIYYWKFPMSGKDYSFLFKKYHCLLNKENEKSLYVSILLGGFGKYCAWDFSLYFFGWTQFMGKTSSKNSQNVRAINLCIFRRNCEINKRNNFYVISWKRVQKYEILETCSIY